MWWAGDAMGVLVVTPFVLSLVLPRHRPRSARWGYVEATVLFVLIALVSLTAIGTDLQFMFLVIPLLGWAAWRFQQRGAAPAALLVVLIASWAARRNSRADASPDLERERERLMSDLARVEGEQQGSLCLVRVHGEIDLSNAHEVSSAIGIAMGQEAQGLVVDQRHHVPRQRRCGTVAPAGGAAAVSATAVAPCGTPRISRSQGPPFHGCAAGDSP